MPIIQFFDSSKGMIFVTWTGEVTAEQWFGYARRLVSNPAWATTQRLLADLQHVTDTATIREPEIEQALRIISADLNALSGKRIAILARDAFGKASYFSQRIARYSVSSVVFNNVDTACLFLGIDTNYASSILLHLQKQLNSA